MIQDSNTEVERIFKCFFPQMNLKTKLHNEAHWLLQNPTPLGEKKFCKIDYALYRVSCTNITQAL